MREKWGHLSNVASHPVCEFVQEIIPTKVGAEFDEHKHVGNWAGWAILKSSVSQNQIIWLGADIGPERKDQSSTAHQEVGICSFYCINLVQAPAQNMDWGRRLWSPHHQRFAPRKTR